MTISDHRVASEKCNFWYKPLFQRYFPASSRFFRATQDRLSASPDRSARDARSPRAWDFMSNANRRTVVGAVLDRKLGSFCKINVSTSLKVELQSFAVRHQPEYNTNSVHISRQISAIIPDFTIQCRPLSYPIAAMRERNPRLSLCGLPSWRRFAASVGGKRMGRVSNAITVVFTVLGALVGAGLLYLAAAQDFGWWPAPLPPSTPVVPNAQFPALPSWLLAALAIALLLSIWGHIWWRGPAQARVEFFPTRHDLRERGGTLDKRFKNVESVFAIWVVGQNFFYSGHETRAVKRLLLPNPESQAFKDFVKSGPHPSAVISVREVAVFAKSKGTEVRFYNSFISHSLILADPDKETGWLHVESVLPYSRTEYRPSYTIYKRDFPDTIMETYRIFNEMWAECKKSNSDSLDQTMAELPGVGAMSATRVPPADPLQIVYEINDPKYVRPTKNRYRQVGEMFWVGIRNAGTTTLHGVTLRAQESWFVDNTFAQARASKGPFRESEPIIETWENIDPGATEMVELFGLSYREDANPDDIFGSVRRFALEARARDTSTVIQEFEYDPDKRPMIMKAH
jgi:hypothetical protein